MTETSLLNGFFGLFRGNREFYVRHQPPFSRKGKKLAAAFCGYAKDPKTDEYLPVTKQQYRDHLNGVEGLAVAPLLNTEAADNVCYYAVIDIDVYEADFSHLVRRMYECGFKFMAFLSKSGGLHIYFMFHAPEDGAAAIQALKDIVGVFGLKLLYTSDKSKGRVEIFPKQATYTPGKTAANCLFLPFYDSAHGSKQKMLTADGTLLPLAKALPLAKPLLTSVKEIRQTLGEMPYSDAPFCVQMILLTGALAEGSGRNEFLFTAALYFKLKDSDSVEAELLKANSLLEDPLEEKETLRIAESALEKNWQLSGRCKKPPCSDYCDRALCRERVCGVGRGKRNMVSNVEFGKITRILAEEPYYLWEARLAGTEEYVEVRIDGEADLLNQKVVQKACIRYLNQTPVTVKPEVWEKTLNSCLAGLEEVEVAEGTDTTEASALRSCFMRFLTRKQARSGQAYLVQTGQAYLQDGVFYFTTEGVKQYLAMEKCTLKGVNLRALLLWYGCSEAELAYTTLKGEERFMQCWQKPEDRALANMTVFYEDIYEGDVGFLRQQTAAGDDGEGGGDDVKF